MSTKNNTRYSMRLRQNRRGDALGNLGNNDVGGDVAAASSRSSSRAALVSLIWGNNDIISTS